MSAQPGAGATRSPQKRRHQVVIVGSGFGGLTAAQKLKRADVDIKLIARTTQHLFQPLLYQVATGILSTGEIAPSTRVVLRKQRNVEVLLGDVTRVDLAGKFVTSDLLGHTYDTPYDSLILAAGAGQSYFGNDQFAEFAPGMKSVDDALELRARILSAFEQAERSRDADRRAKLLTFTVVGAGPTGVEMAGQIAELAHYTLKGAFRRIESQCKVWSAAVAASPLGRDLAEQSSVGLDRAGRVKVLPDLSVPGYPHVFVIGDMAAVEGVPGMAQGAIQGAKHVANTIKAELGEADPAEREPFTYLDKGSMATVSRFSAVAKIGPLEFSGLIAWLAWLLLHLVYLVGFKNKISTLLSWNVTFLSTRRGQLAMTEQQAFARTRLEQLKVLAAEAHRGEAERAAS